MNIINLNIEKNIDNLFMSDLNLIRRKMAHRTESKVARGLSFLGDFFTDL